MFRPNFNFVFLNFKFYFVKMDRNCSPVSLPYGDLGHTHDPSFPQRRPSEWTCLLAWPTFCLISLRIELIVVLLYEGLMTNLDE